MVLIANQTCLHKLLFYQALNMFSIYHTSEWYLTRAPIGYLGGDQPSTIHLQAAEEK